MNSRHRMRLFFHVRKCKAHSPLIRKVKKNCSIPKNITNGAIILQKSY